MKLNNKGWGLGVFLGFVAMFILCIIVVTVNAYKLGLEKDKVPYFSETNTNNQTATPTPTSKYNSLESRILNASMNYKRDKYNEMSSSQTLFVKLSTLTDENYLSDTQDCTGYVKIQNKNNDINYNIYLKCPDYVTEGYDGQHS